MLSHLPTHLSRGIKPFGNGVLVVTSALFVACAPQSPPAGDPRGVPSAGTFDAKKPGEIAAPTASSPAPVVTATASTPPVASSAAVVASAAPIASASAAPAANSDAPDPTWNLKNDQRPNASSDDLTAKASHLFAAVQKDDASLAADFFFPRNAFLPVKDIGNPGKYWDQLFRTYNRDIHDLHNKHKAKMEGAQFVDIQAGSPAKWVPPGEEANKIGYYRSFNAKVRYRVGETYGHFDVRVQITWQGKWFITHLLPWK